MAELVAPAGDLERLKIAFLYGADAVYCGGTVFGLRKFSPNFSIKDLQKGISLGNEKGKRVYLVLNGFARNSDLDLLKSYLEEIEHLQPHALIISDMGVSRLACRYTSIPIHISTQASVTNVYAAKLWKEAGAKRIVLARELTLSEIQIIQKNVPLEYEVFIHGSMCASYSGKCVISNYTAGRDSNRGGCIQTCRHSFDLLDPDTRAFLGSKKIMNARDLNTEALIPDLIKAGIHGFKIEGRMKTHLYLAATVLAYRKAIDKTKQTGIFYRSRRRYCTGGLEQRPFSESIQYEDDASEESVFIGTVKDALPEEGLFIQVKNSFSKGDTLHLFNSGGDRVPFQTQEVWNMAGTPLQTTCPNSVVRLPWIEGSHPNALVFR